MVRYIAYAGYGSHYLVILEKPKKNITDMPEYLWHFIVHRNDRLAVDDVTFEMLKAQAHFGPGKLREVTELEMQASSGI